MKKIINIERKPIVVDTDTTEVQAIERSVQTSSHPVASSTDPRHSAGSLRVVKGSSSRACFLHSACLWSSARAWRAWSRWSTFPSCVQACRVKSRSPTSMGSQTGSTHSSGALDSTGSSSTQTNWRMRSELRQMRWKRWRRLGKRRSFCNCRFPPRRGILVYFRRSRSSI